MKNVKSLLVLILALAMLLSLAACGTSKSDASTVTDAQPAADAAPTEAETKAAEKQQWGFIFEQLTNPNYVTMSGVAKDYCTELGIDIQIVDGRESADTMVSAAENMATMGYNVILLSPMNVDIAASCAEAAKAINPDIVIVNSAIACDACDFTLLQDDWTSGVVSADAAAAFAKEKGYTECFVIGYPRDQALIDREQAFIEEMKKEAPDVEILYYDFSGFNGDFTGASENMMTAHPDCKMAYAISDVLCGFFYETLQASGQDTTQWGVYAVDGTEDGVGWIYANSGFRGTADTGTLEIPKGLIDVALRIQKGEDPATIKIALPVTMITADNVDEYAAKIGYHKD